MLYTEPLRHFLQQLQSHSAWLHYMLSPFLYIIAIEYIEAAMPGQNRTYMPIIT
jgi:hypothetical protein